MSQEKYQKQKEEFKDGLVKFFKTRHSKIFLSPLFEEKDTPLPSFYIRPELNANVSKQTGNDDKISVKSLSQVFKTVYKDNREIYVLADAGVGKTAFSKYLANLWCQFHRPDEDMTDCFDKDDLDCMREFDFLFLILLRDSYDLCSIDDLIFEKIVANLGLQFEPSKEFLLQILKNEKCLVILDGLDEWSHPDKKCYRSPQSIPHRNDRDKCTILTTTRPWKLGVLNLNSVELGEIVKLTKLSKDASDTLTRRILQRLKPHQSEDSLQNDVTKFIEEINSRTNTELTSVPLLLIYSICLWCDGVKVGHSKCDLYVNIVELLLSRTTEKYGELEHSRDLSVGEIPECFAENCMKYYPLLVYLGKLAYYTLFSETKENTLVFDGSIARKYLTPDEMKFTLHSGMLSESTSKTLTKKYSKVSFSHKTVQEFFAALFISSQSDAQSIVREKCRNVQDILDMSKIWEFVSQMNADQMCTISKGLMSVVNEDEETRKYRIRADHEYLPQNILYNMQTMFLSCLQELPESKNIQLCLQDFFIYKDTADSKQLQRLFKQNKANLKSLYKDEKASISKFCLTDLNHIQKLHFEGDIGDNLILFPSLQNVTLYYCTWSNQEVDPSVNLARVQNLQYLLIYSLHKTHKILETILNLISGQKFLKELSLMSFYCFEHQFDCRTLSLDFSQNIALTRLDIHSLRGLQLNISTPSLVNVTMRDVILVERSSLLSRGMMNIERVELNDIKMSAGSLQNFIIVLENLPQSVTVKIVRIQPQTEYERVKENIRRSQTFHVQDGVWPGFEFKTIKPSKE